MRLRLLALLAITGPAASAAPQPLLPVHTILPQTEGRSCRLWLVPFHEDRFLIRVIDNSLPDGDERYKTMDVPLNAGGAVAGVNGGFFNRTPFEPVGLMISEGRASGRFDPKSWMKGLLVVRDARLYLENSDNFQPDRAGISAAIQSGPWLVRGGKAETDNNASQPAPRTFVGHDGNGVWFVGVSNDCTLRDLSILLRSDAVRALIDVREALNLDGGPSTGLWVRGTPRDFYRQEKWPDRNYLAVVPRPATTEPGASPAHPNEKSTPAP